MRRVLIVKLSAIGDVIHALPAAAHLKEAGFEVDWLAEPRAVPILRASPAVERIHVFPRQVSFPWLVMSELAGLLRSLRPHDGYYAVLDLQGLARSALLVAIAKSSRKIGFAQAREASPLVYSRRVSFRGAWPHAVERYLGAARAITGAEPANQADLAFPLVLAPDDFERSRQVLAGAGLAEPYAVLLPSAGKPANRWPPERYRDLARALVRGGLSVLVAGGPEDIGLGEVIAAGLGPGVRSVAGKTDWLSLAALLRQASLAVGSDTGPLHLAAALGRPCLGVYGPADPQRTGPFGQTAIFAEMPCGPCLKRRCPLGFPRPPCQDALPAEAVIAAAWAVLGGLLLKDLPRGMGGWG